MQGTEDVQFHKRAQEVMDAAGSLTQPTPEPAMDRINSEIVGLSDRQQGAIERLVTLKDRLFGDSPEKTKDQYPREDYGPGQIGTIRGHLSEAHYRMTTIENLIDELSQL